MKKILCLILCLLFSVSLFGCNGEVNVTVEKNQYVSYVIEGDEVHYMCYITLKSNKDTAVRITTEVPADYESGFLSNPEVVARDEANGTETIVLKKGINELSLIFVGKHSQGAEKSNNDGPTEFNIYPTEYEISEETVSGDSSEERIYSVSTYQPSNSSEESK